VSQLELFNRRQIYVAFPVRVGETGPIIDRTGPETLRPLFTRDRAIVSIVGAGVSASPVLPQNLIRQGQLAIFVGWA
jgi:hypothetical protein